MLDPADPLDFGRRMATKIMFDVYNWNFAAVGGATDIYRAKATARGAAKELGGAAYVVRRGDNTWGFRVQGSSETELDGDQIPDAIRRVNDG